MSLENVRQNMYTRYIPMVGCPMDHSSASYIYNYLFNCYGINAIMWPLELEKGRLSEFMEARKVFSIDKFALTMPHKADIIPYIDEVDACSRLFNSVNIVRTADGHTEGSGFDGKGCTGALSEAGVDLGGKSVLMIGAGSISGVVGYELTAKGVRDIRILNRTAANAEHVAKVLNDNTPAKVTGGESTPENLDRAAENADLVINVSPLGMHGVDADHPYLGFMERLPGHCTVLDAPVNPPETAFLKAAKAAGLSTIMGMDMMISQMSVIFDFWFGVTPGKQEKAGCKEILFRHFGIKPCT